MLVTLRYGKLCLCYVSIDFLRFSDSSFLLLFPFIHPGWDWIVEASPHDLELIFCVHSSLV